MYHLEFEEFKSSAIVKKCKRRWTNAKNGWIREKAIWIVSDGNWYFWVT